MSLRVSVVVEVGDVVVVVVLRLGAITECSTIDVADGFCCRAAFWPVFNGQSSSMLLPLFGVTHRASSFELRERK